jgi:O-antigen/teichoic acid export membrane protein
MGERTRNTLRNIFTGLVSKVFVLVLPFAVRTIVIYKLGAEYVGLDSLFISILQVLNVTELGFASAIACTMYDPIAQNDTKRICESITLLKTVYKIIGCVILVLGLGLVPVLHLLIKAGMPNDVNIYILYFIHLANTVVSYFFYGYKNTVLSANQRYDVINKVNAVVSIIRGTTQITALLLFSNYYLYIITLPIFSMASNIVVNHYSNVLYPELNVKTKNSLKGIKKIGKQIGGIAIGRISLMCRNSFDSIILSTMIGLNVVAIYSNYYLIFSSISSVLAVILTSMAASVGNSLALNSIEKNEKDHVKFDFYYEVIVTFCTICLFMLYQPFMILWVGEDLTFPFVTMVLFCVYFYVNQLAQVRSVYSEAAGLWWHFRYLTIGEMIANLVLNIGLGYWIGVEGIIIATIITAFGGSFVGCSCITYKKLFNKSPHEYFANNFLYLIVAMCGCILGNIIFGAGVQTNILKFSIRTLLVVFYAGIYLLFVYLLVPKTRRLLSGLLHK